MSKRCSNILKVSENPFQQHQAGGHKDVTAILRPEEVMNLSCFALGVLVKAAETGWWCEEILVKNENHAENIAFHLFSSMTGKHLEVVKKLYGKKPKSIEITANGSHRTLVGVKF